MKIIQTPVRFYPYIGGVESYVYDISKELVDKGHEVIVVCANHNDGYICENISGITVHRVPKIGSIAKTHITPQLPIKLLRECKDADVIHTHLPTPWSADISSLMSKFYNVPLVTTYHNDITGAGVAKAIAAIYNATSLRMTLNISDKILITQPDYLDNSKHLGDYQEKVSVINNGVDVDRFKPIVSEQSNKTNLFFLSVLDEYHQYKGLDVLLKAMEDVANRVGPTPTLTVGGDGELRPQYESIAQTLGIEEHVEFLGRVPEEELVSVYNKSDLFILPSVSSDQEGFGLVLLEALSCGTPVLTTDVVGISNEVNNEPIGCVVQKNDPKALADVITQYEVGDLDIDEERCREVCVEQYSWKESVNKLIEVYKVVQ